MPVLITAVALLGLAVGSFLNVVIHRVPRGESLVAPGLALPGLRRGRSARGTTCRCSAGWCCAAGAPTAAAPISARYPLVELVTARALRGDHRPGRPPRLLAALPAYLFFAAAGDRPRRDRPRRHAAAERDRLPELRGARRAARPSPRSSSGSVEPLRARRDRRRRAVRVLPRLALANPAAWGWAT